MRWAATFLFGIGVSLAAGAASACPQATACEHRTYSDAYHDGRWSDRYAERDYGPSYDYRADEPFPEDDYGYGGGHVLYDDGARGPDLGGLLAWPKPDGWYIHGHRAPPCAAACAAPPPCGCVGARVSLNDSFFYDAGGVGPIPAGDFGYGGGFAYVDGGAFAGASSRAFASASARSSASVSIRGGHKHGYGGKGGYKGGGHKGGKHH